jgi:hypothetical protein
MKMFVAPNMDVGRRGVLIGSIAKLGRRIGWNFSMKEFELKFGITNSNY